MNTYNLLEMFLVLNHKGDWSLVIEHIKFVLFQKVSRVKENFYFGYARNKIISVTGYLNSSKEGLGYF